MRCVYIIAVSALLAGCSSWVDDYSSVGMAPVMSSADTVSAKTSGHTMVYAGDADNITDRDALALRRSAWHFVRIRGDAPANHASANDTADFCKAVANAAVSTVGYDPATSHQIEVMRLAQCREMAGL